MKREEGGREEGGGEAAGKRGGGGGAGVMKTLLDAQKLCVSPMLGGLERFVD